MSGQDETALYAPIKTFLEDQGHRVKAEVNDCDVVAIRGDEPPVIVELKRAFSLDLVLQGIERQRLTDRVYLAIPAPDPGSGTLWNRRRGSVIRLCRMLGLGLLVVHRFARRPPWVEPLLDPAPYRPRRDAPRRERLLREFAQRVGDPNRGGTTRRPIVTAYRQQALRCAAELGPAALALAELRTRSGVERAATILQRDVYGWFERVERGVYRLTPRGHEALEIYADDLRALHREGPLPRSETG